MGLFFSDTWSKWFGNNEPRCLLLGLEGSGKLTILLKIKLGMHYPSIPIIDYSKYNICAFHIGGKYSDDLTWRRYLNNTKSIIFVVDASDNDSIDESCIELHKILNEDKLRDAALLVFANKQDLPNAIKAQELEKRLRLDTIQNRVFHVQELCAIYSDGLFEGFDWLNEQTKNKK